MKLLETHVENLRLQTSLGGFVDPPQKNGCQVQVGTSEILCRSRLTSDVVLKALVSVSFHSK